MLSVLQSGFRSLNRLSALRLLSSFVLLLLSPVLYAADAALDSVKKPLLIDPVSASSIFQLILMLLFVVALILFAAWFFRRLGQFGGSANQVIRYLGGISVGQRERIVLIEVGETQLLIGVAPGRVEKLYKLDTPIEIDTATSNGSFARKLAEIMNKKESPS
ncbi:MAG TPA: flagellar biosynthetic protein FliO [Ectothiorhodospiraceae bacterium]|nr:flagellar biosynthetic protein FliO [Ectothiorhodospiraceae bacterium]